MDECMTQPHQPIAAQTGQAGAAKEIDRRLVAYIAMMAPHQLEREGGRLIIESLHQIRDLKEAVKALREAALLIIAWEDRLLNDQMEKLIKRNVEEACKNWDWLVSEPLNLTPLRETIAATAHLVEDGE